MDGASFLVIIKLNYLDGWRQGGGKLNGCTIYLKRVFCMSMSGMVHTRVEVCKMDSEMSRLVKQPWLQLMYCTACLPRGHNFR